ncbi:aspartic peptidase domain-containing protein [Chytriomyces cf. hyalinus JEL632]|nr:aspartic peptidase domain-containing protein [Chytriomyces cf. hyalinus JEL632]
MQWNIWFSISISCVQRSAESSMRGLLLLLAPALAASQTQESADPQPPLIIPLSKRSFSRSTWRAPGDGQDALSLPLENLQNTVYFISASFGTPQQQFTLQLDTGSAISWIGSSQCQQTGKCNDSRGFDPLASSSFSDISNQQVRNIRYFSGSVSGYDSADTAAFGRLTIPKQTFLLVTQQDAVIQSQQMQLFDGVLGFALNRDANTLSSYPTVMDNLLKLGTAMDPVFSIWLNSNGVLGEPVQTSPNGGQLTIGGIDPSKYEGNLTFYPVVGSKFHWEVHISRVTISLPQAGTLQNRAGILALPSGTSAIFDTGSSLIAIEASFLQSSILPVLFSAIKQPFSSLLNPVSNNASDVLIIPCSARSVMPSISFDFGDGVLFTIPGQDLVVHLSEKLCFLPIVPTRSKTWILGDTFMIRHYVAFRYGNSVPGSASETVGSTLGIARSISTSWSDGQTAADKMRGPSEVATQAVPTVVSASSSASMKISSIILTVFVAQVLLCDWM